MFGQNKSDDSAQPAQDQNWQHPGEPVDSTPTVVAPTPAPTPADDSVATPSPVPDIMPASTENEVVQPAEPESNQNDKDELVDVSSHDLIEIKQKALGELHPLMEHLDQNPEEKFKTIMMMIQASDDQTQIKTAYEAAKEIKDDKVRAQALLDIVNEINYFTQKDAK